MWEWWVGVDDRMPAPMAYCGWMGGLGLDGHWNGEEKGCQNNQVSHADETLHLNTQTDKASYHIQS